MLNNPGSSPYPSQPASMSPFQTWTMALAPSEQNYVQIARDPNATAGRAYLWLVVAFLVGGVISTIIGAGVNLIFGPSVNPFLPALAPARPGLGSVLISLVCGVPIGAVLLVIGTTIGIGLQQLLASALGGKGAFSQLIYAYSAYYVPIFIASSFISSIPFVNFLLVFTGLYALVLNVIATKAVHQFGWGRAIAASVLIPLLLLVLVGCLLGLVLVLLGPAIGNVFSSIVTGI